MNPSTYDDDTQAPRPAAVPDTDLRLGNKGTNEQIIDAKMAAQRSNSNSKQRLPSASSSMSPTKELLKTNSNVERYLPAPLPHDKDNMSINSDDTSHKSSTTLKTSASDPHPNSLKSMLGLQRSNSPSSSCWGGGGLKPIGLPTSVSVKSATRQRFARRNSYVSDMVVARSSRFTPTTGRSTTATHLINQALRAQEISFPNTTTTTTTASSTSSSALGYGDEEGDSSSLKRRQHQQGQEAAAAPPMKRRRYQRRNSFYIPETSRSSEQPSNFSWKAMDFLYGQTGTGAAAATTTTAPLSSLTGVTRESPTPSIASSAD